MATVARSGSGLTRITPRGPALFLVLGLVLAAARTGEAASTPERDPAPLFPAEALWTLTLTVLPSAGGAIDGERAYIPLQNGELAAFDRETGAVLWTSRADTRLPPLVTGGVVVVAGADTVVGLDARTGLVRWTRPAVAAAAAPVGAPGGAILATTDGRVLLVATDSGGVRWDQAVEGVATHPAAVGDGVVVVTTGSARVVALDVATGARRWTRTFEGTLSQPAVGRDRVFVGSTTNLFFALRPSSGEEVWRWRLGGDVMGADVDEDFVYVSSLDNILRAFNRGNGNQRWKKALETRPAAPPIAVDGVVVSAGVAPRVDAYIGNTGTGQGTHQAAGDLEGVPLVDRVLRPYRSAMIVVTRDGRVSSLRPVGMMMREPQTSPLTDLPGRRLPREPEPVARP